MWVFMYGFPKLQATCYPSVVYFLSTVHGLHGWHAQSCILHVLMGLRSQQSSGKCRCRFPLRAVSHSSEGTAVSLLITVLMLIVQVFHNQHNWGGGGYSGSISIPYPIRITPCETFFRVVVFREAKRPCVTVLYVVEGRGAP